MTLQQAARASKCSTRHLKPSAISSLRLPRIGWSWALVALVFVFISTSPANAQTFGCTSQTANPIVCENSKPGNPSTDWGISGAGDPTIQGFGTDISVNQ